METLTKKHRQRGKNKRIGFSNEIVSKEVAKSLILTNRNEGSTLGSTSVNQSKDSVRFNKKEARKTRENISSDLLKQKDFNLFDILDSKLNDASVKSNQSNDTIKKGSTSNTKMRKRKERVSLDSNDQNETIIERNEGEDLSKVERNSSDIDKSLSKRSLKKMKHQKLLEDRKVQVNMVLQQKVLDYLLSWKNNRACWKFEKLKQNWLLQNLYDSNKISDNFWGIVIEYFSNSKGKVYDTILKKAIHIIENEVDITDTNKVKLQRARDIIQNLQE